MKKGLVIAVICLLIALIVVLTACNDNTVSEECVRIHIRANSNSIEDQAVKLKVRDAITLYLSDKLEGLINKEQALSALSDSLCEIKKIAADTLSQNGFDYGVSAKISNEKFPEREYDGFVFPGGYYDALIIELGEGSGDNWWCVAFPPLCFVPDGGDKI
ncbi:MAG: stage II sporulation protein R, partial [Clostridiales bacterium]|nr:stage II sporulation protein R [Clostridiales bacterium]